MCFANLFFKIFRSTFVFIILIPTFALSNQCKDLFTISSYKHYFNSKKAISKTEIFNQAIEIAMKSIPELEGDSYISKKINDFKMKFNVESKFLKDLMIEIEKRNLNNAARLLGIEVKSDLKFKITNNANMINIIFSSLLNATYSMVSLNSSGLPIIHIPKIEFFKISKLTDRDILILLEKGESDSQFYNTIAKRYRYNYYYNYIFRALFHASIAIFILGDEIEYYLHPEKMIEKMIDDINLETYNRNLKNITIAKERLEYYRSIGNLEAINHFEALIMRVQQHNIELLSPIKSDQES